SAGKSESAQRIRRARRARLMSCRDGTVRIPATLKGWPYTDSAVRIDCRNVEARIDEAVVLEARTVGRRHVRQHFVDVAVGQTHAACREAPALPRHDVVAAVLDQKSPALVAIRPGDPL